MRAHFAYLIVAAGCLAMTPPVSAQYEQSSEPASTVEEQASPPEMTETPVPGFAALPISQPRMSRPRAEPVQHQAVRQAPPPQEAPPPETVSPSDRVSPAPEYAQEQWTEEPVWEGEYGPGGGEPHGWDNWGHSYDGCRCDYCCNPWRFSVDFLSMQPQFSGQDFAIVDPNTDSQPDGAFSSIDASRANGLQVYFGRELIENWDLAIRYTYLVNTNSRFVQAPAGGQLWATMTHPNTVNIANTADARLKFKYHVLDAELGRELDLTPSLDTRVFGGVRFAWIDHDLSVLYNGGDATFDQILSPLKFSGNGLRLGGQTNWRLPAGWSLFGEASTALLVGTIDTSLLEANNNSTTTIVNVSDRQTFGTPVLELGIGAARTWGPWELRAGYRLSHWFNVLQRRDFSDDLHAGKSTTRTSDLMLDGFFVGLGLGR